MSDRTRGVIVQEIDLTSVKSQLLTHFQEKDPTITAVNISYRWATTTDPQGRDYLICDEGIGAVFSDDDPCEIEVHVDRDARSMSLMPEGIIRFTPTLLADLPRAEIDLADFIRTFGARLEQNFAEHYGILTGTP